MGCGDALSAWRCQACGILVYNIRKGYPVPGAPNPYELVVDAIDLAQIKVCSVCAELHSTVSRKDYFRGLHNQWVSDQKDKAKHIKKLSTGKNYLTDDE